MRRTLAIGLLLALICSPLLGQRFTSSIRGKVTVPTGETIGGVQVTVTNTDTGLTRTSFTNQVGTFSFPDLPVGNYRLEVEAEGFNSIVQNLYLNVADTREINFQLEVGQITDEVTVTSSAVVVETIGGEVAGLITGEQIRELPLNGRNFLQLTQLMPGVSTLDNFNTKNKGLLSGSDVSVSGGRVTANMWTVDGANNNDVGSNRTILIYPSLEAVEEFKVHRNSYGAEFGGAGGAQVNLVTRAGTNSLKGSVFYFRRDDGLNETNYILRRAGLPKEPLERDDYGFTLGGAIKRDKLHYFVSSEWNDEQRGIATSSFVPTAAEKRGDFSQSNPACSPIPVDPLTGQAFPGNVIPLDRISDAGALYLQLYPDANFSEAGSCTNWISPIDVPINWEQINARVDWNVNQKTRFMLRYTEDDWDNLGPTAGDANGLWGDDPFPAVDSAWVQPSESVVAQLNQVIGTSALNTVTLSLSGNEINISQTGDLDLMQRIINSTPPVFAADKTASPRAHPVFWGGGGLPALWNAGPWDNDQDLKIFKDDYEQVFGNHVLKAGVLYNDARKAEITNGASAGEATSYWGGGPGSGAGIGGWGANSGNTIADFLLEDMTFGFSERSFNQSADSQWEDFEVYIADSWKVLPNLTFDYGVRYSRFDWPYDANREIALNFNPDRFDPALGGDPCNGLMQAPGTDPCGAAGFLGGSAAPNKSLVENDTDNFAPRLGLAWDISGNGNSVLRAGFGQFFQRERVSPQLSLANNPPLIDFTAGIRSLDGEVEFLDFVGAGRPQSGFDPDAETPYMLQYNLSWEQRLGRDSTIEVGYVASRGRSLLTSLDINQVRSGDPNGNGIPDRLEYVRCPSGDGGAGCRGALRTFSAFGDGSILYWLTDGNSEYDSLQVQFTTRFGRGSQFQASYTLSDFEADVGVGGSSGGLDAEETVTDLDNRGLDFGQAELHRDHVFNASLITNLPTFEGRGGFMEYLLGNWSIGAIAIYASGSPIAVFAGNPGGDLGGQAPSGLGYSGNNRPIRTGASCSAGGDLQVINPSAFTLTGFQLGDPSAMAERHSCEGPDFLSLDFSFYKQIPVGDRFQLQLRFEIFNIFNRNNLVAQSVDRSFNAPVTLDGPQDQATGVVATGAPSPTFGQAFEARDPRQVQLGIKLSF